MSATETLEQARTARAAGDVGLCVELSARALSEAREAREWETAYLAAAAPGRMYMDREEPGYALMHVRAALDVAREGGLCHWLGPCYLDLSIASYEAGNWWAARRFLGTGLDIFYDMYPLHPRSQALSANLAWQSFDASPSPETARDAHKSYVALERVLPTPDVHVYSAARRARAAAALHCPRRYSEAVSHFDRSFGLLTSYEGVASDLTNVAAGACAYGDFPSAARYAERAILMAGARDEPRVRERAEGVRDAALSERRVLQAA